MKTSPHEQHRDTIVVSSSRCSSRRLAERADTFSWYSYWHDQAPSHSTPDQLPPVTRGWQPCGGRNAGIYPGPPACQPLQRSVLPVWSSKLVPAMTETRTHCHPEEHTAAHRLPG